jgi:molecular chaperone GrpE
VGGDKWETKKMKDKKKKNENPTGSEGESGETILETLGNEFRSHREEDRETPEKEFNELKEKLEEKEKEVRDHHDRLLRVAADFENYKKRAAREKEDWVKYANEDLMKGILPFVDNLERALNHAEKAETSPNVMEGLKLTLQQLLQTLFRFGLSPIESVGKPFDPTVHEAMIAVETDQHEPNQVLEEFQKGYFLKDRLLRPSTVSVSKAREQSNS